MVCYQCDVLSFPDASDNLVLYRPSRGIIHMKDSLAGMGGLSGDMKGVLRFFRKFDPYLLNKKFGHQSRAFTGKDSHCFRITEACSGLENILFQEFGRIIFPLCHNAPLGIPCVRFFRVLRPCYHRHVKTLFGRCQGCDAAGQTASENQHICLKSFFILAHIPSFIRANE